MQFFLALAAILAVSCSSHEIEKRQAKSSKDGGEKRVVCYYTNWSVYRKGLAKFSPQNINPYLCTHLVYAFGGLTDEFEVNAFDSYQDIEQGGYAQFNGLKQYNKGMKTLLALGGWNEGSARFSELVSFKDYRDNFTLSAIRHLRRYNFDGLDLDWEYPGSRDGSAPEDKQNYAILVKELREAFELEASKSSKSRLLLTMAVPAGQTYIDRGYDIPMLDRYLDFFNMLTYDYHSVYEPTVNHHAALFAPPGVSEYEVNYQLNVDWTVRYYLKKGASKDKLVVGIPTYGRSYTLLDGDFFTLGSSANGPGAKGNYTNEKGYLAFYEVCEVVAVDGWEVRMPYPKRVGPFAFKADQWVGYDDESVVEKKSEYVRDSGLGGIMFWTIDSDDFRGLCNGRQYPLIEAAKEALYRESPTAENEARSLISGGSTRINEISSRRKSPKTTTTAPEPSKRRRPGRRRPGSQSTGTIDPLNTPEPPTTPSSVKGFNCKREGFYPNPDDCRKYYWCLDSGASGLGIVAHGFTCPSDLIFNKKIDGCDHPDRVKCKIGNPNRGGAKATSTTTAIPRTTEFVHLQEDYDYYYDLNLDIDPVKPVPELTLIDEPLEANVITPTRNSGGSQFQLARETALEQPIPERAEVTTEAPSRNLGRERSRPQYSSIQRDRTRVVEEPAIREETEVVRQEPTADVRDEDSFVRPERPSSRPRRPQYVTLNRQRPEQDTLQVAEPREEFEPDVVETATQGHGGLNYVTLNRRRRPSTEPTILVEDKVTNAGLEYVTLFRSRPEATTEIVPDYDYLDVEPEATTTTTTSTTTTTTTTTKPPRIRIPQRFRNQNTRARERPSRPRPDGSIRRRQFRGRGRTTPEPEPSTEKPFITERPLEITPVASPVEASLVQAEPSVDTVAPVESVDEKVEFVVDPVETVTVVEPTVEKVDIVEEVEPEVNILKPTEKPEKTPLDSLIPFLNKPSSKPEISAFESLLPEGTTEEPFEQQIETEVPEIRSEAGGTLLDETFLLFQQDNQESQTDIPEEDSTGRPFIVAETESPSARKIETTTSLVEQPETAAIPVSFNQRPLLVRPLNNSVQSFSSMESSLNVLHAENHNSLLPSGAETSQDSIKIPSNDYLRVSQHSPQNTNLSNIPQPPVKIQNKHTTEQYTNSDHIKKTLTSFGEKVKSLQANLNTNKEVTNLKDFEDLRNVYNDINSQTLNLKPELDKIDSSSADNEDLTYLFSKFAEIEDALSVVNEVLRKLRPEENPTFNENISHLLLETGRAIQQELNNSLDHIHSKSSVYNSDILTNASKAEVSFPSTKDDFNEKITGQAAIPAVGKQLTGIGESLDTTDTHYEAKDIRGITEDGREFRLRKVKSRVVASPVRFVVGEYEYQYPYASFKNQPHQPTVSRDDIHEIDQTANDSNQVSRNHIEVQNLSNIQNNNVSHIDHSSIYNDASDSSINNAFKTQVFVPHQTGLIYENDQGLSFRNEAETPLHVENLSQDNSSDLIESLREISLEPPIRLDEFNNDYLGEKEILEDTPNTYDYIYDLEYPNDSDRSTKNISFDLEDQKGTKDMTPSMSKSNHKVESLNQHKSEQLPAQVSENSFSNRKGFGEKVPDVDSISKTSHEPFDVKQTFRDENNLENVPLNENNNVKTVYSEDDFGKIPTTEGTLWEDSTIQYNIREYETLTESSMIKQAVEIDSGKEKEINNYATKSSTAETLLEESPIDYDQEIYLYDNFGDYPTEQGDHSGSISVSNFGEFTTAYSVLRDTAVEDAVYGDKVASSSTKKDESVNEIKINLPIAETKLKNILNENEIDVDQAPLVANDSSYGVENNNENGYLREEQNEISSLNRVTINPNIREAITEETRPKTNGGRKYQIHDSVTPTPVALPNTENYFYNDINDDTNDDLPKFAIPTTISELKVIHRLKPVHVDEMVTSGSGRSGIRIRNRNRNRGSNVFNTDEGFLIPTISLENEFSSFALKKDENNFIIPEKIQKPNLDFEILEDSANFEGKVNDSELSSAKFHSDHSSLTQLHTNTNTFTDNKDLHTNLRPLENEHIMQDEDPNSFLVHVEDSEAGLRNSSLHDGVAQKNNPLSVPSNDSSLRSQLHAGSTHQDSEVVLLENQPITQETSYSHFESVFDRQTNMDYFDETLQPQTVSPINKITSKLDNAETAQENIASTASTQTQEAQLATGMGQLENLSDSLLNQDTISSNVLPSRQRSRSRGSRRRPGTTGSRDPSTRSRNRLRTSGSRRPSRRNKGPSNAKGTGRIVLKRKILGGLNDTPVNIFSFPFVYGDGKVHLQD